MSLAFWISALSFILVLLAGLTISFAVSSRQEVKVWRDRVERTGHQNVRNPNSLGLERLMDHLVYMLERVGRLMKPSEKGEMSRLRQSLITAGYRASNAATIFLGAKITCMMLVPIWVFLLRSDRMKILPSFIMLIVYVAATTIGFYLPDLWLRVTKARRQRRLLEAFPDAIDLMVICIESGLGLVAAIGRVGEELKFAHPDLSDEFHLLSFELRSGLSRQEALRNLSWRIGLADVQSLVAMLVQTDRFGTSVAQALRVHSEYMRKQRHLRAEEQAAKVPVKLMIPLVLFIFPNLFIVIVGPGVIRIFRTLLPALGGH